MVNRFINDKQKAASMLYLDFMRSFEASYRELIDEGNEAAMLTVYDTPAAQNVPVPEERKAAMSNAVLETFPPAGRALTDIVMEYFAHVVTGKMQAMPALEELQKQLDDYAVPE
jgi:ABC-type glycerol-3-phosphate transport system substrate-binding protein